MVQDVVSQSICQEYTNDRFWWTISLTNSHRRGFPRWIKSECKPLSLSLLFCKEWTKTGLLFKLRRDRTFEILMVYEGKKGQGREQHPWSSLNMTHGHHDSIEMRWSQYAQPAPRSTTVKYTWPKPSIFTQQIQGKTESTESSKLSRLHWHVFQFRILSWHIYGTSTNWLSIISCESCATDLGRLQSKNRWFPLQVLGSQLKGVTSGFSPVQTIFANDSSKNL